MDYPVVSPKEARYDFAPIAWTCPLDYEPSSRVLFVCDPGHATHENLVARKEFALALPDFEQVENSGSTSGRARDKFKTLAARALEGAWRRRLHYVSEGLYYAPGAPAPTGPAER